MNRRAIVLVTALLLAVTLPLGSGCNGKTKPQKLTGQPNPPPAVPAKRNVPLNRGLRDAARKEVEKGMKSGDALVRISAVEAAQRGLGADAAPIVLTGLNDADWGVRFASAIAAGELQLTDALPRLYQMGFDENRSVQAAVRFAIHKMGDTRYSHDLEMMARDSSPQVRGNVALVLGLIGDPSALKILRAMENDPDAVVRLKVAEARWRLGDEDALDSLVAGTISSFPDDQMISILALAGPRDTHVTEHIQGKLTSDYSEISLAAARAMGMLGSDAGYTVAMNGTKSVDPRLRQLGALALGDIGRRDAQDMLGRLLKDTSPNVRLAAAMAILELK